ncbi:hypothetical protein ABPG75_013030 [Micractinium tetrahymenae]
MAYSYLELSQAVERVGQLVNLWAAVLECSVPRPTRGTDMVCNLTLVDPSTQDRPELAAGVEMLCFAASPEELPHLQRPGDIIRLHRVKVNHFNEKPQLVGKVGARGAGFAYCLFHGIAPAGGAADLPYQSSHYHYHFDAREAELLVKLRECFAELNCTRMGGSSQYLRRICDVRPGVFFDCLCRVVAADDSGGTLRLLFIWDDTDALPFPATYDTREQEETADLQRQHQHLRTFALPLQDLTGLPGIPLVGTALPVVFPKSGRVEQPPVGSWIKMRNLGARVVNGQLQAFYHRQKSRWTPWQDEARQAELEGEYRQRLAANHTAGWAPDPRAAGGELLALCRHRDRPISTVRQVLLDTPAATPRCYRLLVRLVDYQPRDPAEMCHPAAACGLPGAASGSWVYTLKLLVEDATGQLDVIVFGADGNAFFAGLPARDLHADPAAAGELQRCMQCLLGQGCQRDGGPWMELSIRAYFTDPAHPWQSRQYRVCDTSLTLLQQRADPAGGG